MSVTGLVRSLDPRVRERKRHLRLVEEACRTKSISSSHDPVEVTLEITTYCNIRCTMCAISWDPRFDPKAKTSGHMTLETVQALEPILPHVVPWYLMGVGEPLINPAFLSIVEFVTRHGAQTQFNTNGTQLTATLADRFIDLGVHTITYSIDGATRATYDAIRRGADFDQVVENIRAMRDLKRRRRTRRPHTSFAMVVMADNVHEVVRMVELAAELEVSHVHFEPLLWQDDPDGYGRFYQQQTLGRLPAHEVADQLGAAKDRAAALGVGVSSQLFEATNTFDYPDHLASDEPPGSSATVSPATAAAPELICTEPWTTLFITWDGDVRTCCGSTYAFGNLTSSSLSDVWTGKSYREVREQLAAGVIPDMCSNCVRNGRMRHALPHLRDILER